MTRDEQLCVVVAELLGKRWSPEQRADVERYARMLLGYDWAAVGYPYLYEPRKSVAPECFRAFMDKRQQPRSAPKDRCGVSIHLSEQLLDICRG